jgi:hypothetical protein
MAKVSGNITALLGQKYRDLGFVLTEDEDFVYLSPPGKGDPWVYSSHGVSIDRIHKEIEMMLAGEKRHGMPKA